MAAEPRCEEIPLKGEPEGKMGDKPSSPGVVVSKLKLFMVLGVFVVLIILIIILAAFLGAKGSTMREKEADEGSVDKEGGDKPTILPPGPWDILRLPRSVTPSHYELHLDVDPNKDGFSGHETITVDVTEETSHILIHSSGLNITETSIMKPDSSSVSIINHFDAKKNAYHVIETEQFLIKGKYMLKYKFHGLYRTSLFGLFKGVHRQNDGKMAAFLSTQLEPIDARTMFPCFDEPAMKATFNISLAYPKDMVGLSNGEVEKQQDKGQTRLTYYKTTPKMSTYLVSVVVGHFESKHLIIPRGVKLRAFAQPGNTDQMDFALRMGKETLVQMEQTFGIKYPLPKLDLVATPECFIAMENWGSIRFEEDGLLYKKDFSSEEIQQDLLVRWLVHEIVHMWFGNYVTMKWWNDLWLNEAVTDFFTYFDGSPKALAAWKRDVQFIHTNLGYALGIDGYVNSRPVVVPLDAPTVDMFDNVVYKKGSSLLNMVKHSYPKKENYNKGMKNYLHQFAYGSTVSDNMWDMLQTTCSLKECPNFKEAMETWMTKKNYPVLTVKKTGNGKYTVQQERFVYDKTAKLDKLLWRVQFKYYTSATNESTVTSPLKYDKWLTNNVSAPVHQVEIFWDGKGWIKGNLKQIGFYRVNYDDATWGQLAHQLLYYHVVFSEADRYGLIDDAFNLARGERVSIKRALDVTRYVFREKNYLPWMAVQKNVDYILGILPDHSRTARYLKIYVAYQTHPLLKTLGFQNTGSHLDKLLRMMTVDFHCRADSTICLGNMTSMFNEWKKDPLTSSITPALRKLVYFYGVRKGSSGDWDLVLEQLQKNTIASEFQPLLMGLAGTRHVWNLYRYLELMNNETIVKEQYLKYALDDIANHNADGADIMWNFLKYNWDQLKASDPVSAMLKYLPITTKRFSTMSKLNELVKFINENLNGQPIPRVLRRTVEIVRLNIAWRKAHESHLEEWLKDFLKSKNIPSGDKAGFGDAA